MPKVDVAKIIQELVVPELHDIKSSVQELRTRFDSEIKRLDEKIDSGLRRLDEKIDSGLRRVDEKIELVRNELKAEISGLKKDIDSLRNELDAFKNEFRAEIKRLDEKIDIAIQIRERLAALESKVASLIK